jgi:murein DD-endopeptidase MepM/ murein hydrolase activator NlpD
VVAALWASPSKAEEAGCGDVTFEGDCRDDVLTWCEDGELRVHDCVDGGLICRWATAEVGFDCLPPGGGFGYPVGDGTSPPAGGWTVTQVLGHYLDAGDFEGGHLAQDLALSEEETANAPVMAIADGEVLYAGANDSSYVNVVLIRHEEPGVGVVCSFYGHLGSVSVAEGDPVLRGDVIATVLDWSAHFGWPNSHLHYVVLAEELCLASHAASGALVCGYDETRGVNDIDTLDDEPATYTSVGDPCGAHAYPDAFISPSQLIAAHHFLGG